MIRHDMIAEHRDDIEDLEPGNVEIGKRACPDVRTTVLGFHLEAVCTNGIELAVDGLQGLDEGAITLFDTGVADEGSPAGGGSPAA